MHLQWMFIIWMVSCWITATEEKMGSLDLIELLSAWTLEDHEIETVVERSLSRGKRAAGAVEYTVDIEISFPDPSFANQIKQFIARNLTFPIPLGPNDTEIQSISVTTACNQSGGSMQCSCESGYLWPDAVCASYNICPGSNASHCSCINGSNILTQYCQPFPESINLSIRLNEEFTADFKDPSSAKYKKYKADLEVQFIKVYKPLSGFRSAAVTGFRPGSLIVDYTVVTEPVSPSTMTTANSQLISNLRSANYDVDPSVTSIVTNQSNITVTPTFIFNKDRVVLTCSVGSSSYSSVAWYFNGTETIQNSSYRTSVSAGTIHSILTIHRASLSDTGTYLCVIDDTSTSYQAQTAIIVQPLEMKVLNTTLTCNAAEVPIMECCTQGLSVDFDMTCAVRAGIQGIARNNTPCKTYQLQADEETCTHYSAGSYDCTCSTMNGANETRNVKVTYKGIHQATYGATVSSKVDTISEGRELTMQCDCNATSVQNISWSFQNNSISPQYYTINRNMCASTLTIPSNVTTVAWNGTYRCSVDIGSHGVVSASRAMRIARLVRAGQISRSPVTLGFLCKQSINFSCCISNTIRYKGAVLEIVTKSGSSQKDMTVRDPCFTATYTPATDSECVTFRARCTITNAIDDTVSSGYMDLTYVKEAKCTTPYIGDVGAITTVSCRDDNPTLTGTKNFTCIRTGSSATWNLTYSGCVSVALDNIKNQLETLTSPIAKDLVPSVLENLTSTVITDKGSVSASPNDISLVVSLLEKVDTALDRVEAAVMEDFLETVNVIVDNTTTWDRIPDRAEQSSTLLQSVENFAEKLSITGPVNIRNNSNIQLSGNIISSLTTDYTADFHFNQTNNLTGNVLITRKSLRSFLANATVVSVAYATMKDILTTPDNAPSALGVINGLVMTTTVTDNYNNFQIEMDFKKSNQTLNKPTCVYWNFTIHDWDGTGCRTKNSTDSTMVTCVCDHLTSFSILMSYANLDPTEDLILTYISYIGLGISILSLVICIIIEATVWKSVTKNKTSYMRHVCIMNIAVTLLMADVWFIIGSAMSDIKKVDACVAATFFTHLFYLCTFFWMLTMGLILFYRLMCVFHDLSKTIMMGISFFLGYGCPIIISVITVAVTQPSKKYTTGQACWLNMKESKAFLAFIIPALTILLINFITLFVVIIKVLRPSVGDKPKKEEKSSLNHIAKCILILTPLLGLTWGFGIGTLLSRTVVIDGIFAALNALQGLFILLFGCLMDKKVRDALFSRFSVSRWSSQQTKSSNLSTADPVFSKGVINLFARKDGASFSSRAEEALSKPKAAAWIGGSRLEGVYNISSAQAGSSSEMSNSYSLLT